MNDGGLRPGKQIVGYDFPVSPDIVVQVTSLRAQSRYFSDLIQVIGGEEVRLVERISLARQGVSGRRRKRRQDVGFCRRAHGGELKPDGYQFGSDIGEIGRAA